MNKRLLYIGIFLLLLLCFSACGETDEVSADGDADVDIEADEGIDGDAENTETDAESGEVEIEAVEEEAEVEAEIELETDLEAVTEEEDEAEEPLYSGVLFRFPLINEEGLYSEEYVFGVDHDPEVHEGVGTGICSNYDGKAFPNCYDEHHGSDFILHGGFEKMDEGVAFIYAAADGTVLETEDGNYDRCHIDYENLGSGNISCDGNPIRANYVKIDHAGGIVSMYYHMASGSILVQPGDVVTCGQTLGRVGSSGISSCPHLHFQVETSEGNIIDPFMGELSQPWSYWVEQKSASEMPGETCQQN